MAADWIGVDSSHIHSVCGDDGNNPLSGALNGTGLWRHDVDEDHEFVLNFGAPYNITKVRGRSDSGADPTSVDIYINDTGSAPWGTAVASGIIDWQDSIEWVETDTTDKVGQYIRVVITSTEHPTDEIVFGKSSPFMTIFDVYGEIAAVSVTVYPDTLALALTLQTPSILFDYTILPTTLELALTQHAPTIICSSTISPSALALVANLLTPEILAGVVIAPASLSLALTQHVPGVVIDCTVIPDTFELALTQHAPTVFPIVTVTPDSMTLAVALLSPVVVIDVTVTPDTFALALTQHAPTISAATIIYPAVLALEAAIHAPVVSIRFTDIPPFMQKDLITPYSGGAWLWLCEIAVPGYDNQDLARNTKDVRYAGKDYKKWNFDIGKQTFAGDGSIPRVVLRVGQDPDHVIEDIVNASEGCHDGTVKLIRVNEKFLDYEVEALEVNYGVLVADSDTEWVYFTLGIPNPLTQRIPLNIGSSKICPWAIPGLFKGPRCQYTGDDLTCTGTLNDCNTKGNAHHWGAEIGLDPNVTRV